MQKYQKVLLLFILLIIIIYIEGKGDGIMRRKLIARFFAAAILCSIFIIQAAAALHGDVDRDGKLTPNDARITLRASTGIETLKKDSLTIADTDGDGRITASDARTILRASIGIEDISKDHNYSVSVTRNSDGAIVTSYTCRICGDGYKEREFPKEDTEKREEPATAKEEPTTKKEEPTTTRQEPTTKKQEPTTVKPEPTTKKQEPTTVKQEPTTVKPEPTTVSPEPTTVPEPETTTLPRPDRKPITYNHNQKISIDGTIIQLGMTLDQLENQLGKPSRTDNNYKTYTAYTYKLASGGYVLAYVRGGKAEALYVGGPGFACGKFTQGKTFTASHYQPLNLEEIAYVYTDKNDSYKIYALFIHFEDVYIDLELNAPACFTETSKQLFDMTNAFRSQYGLDALTWNDKAADVAEAHSKDMASNNYATHTNTAGMEPWDRAVKAGIRFHVYAENIAGGYSAPYNTADQWINSASHRETMLDGFTYLGIGGAYNVDSSYRYYWTQNFYLP